VKFFLAQLEQSTMNMCIEERKKWRRKSFVGI